MINSYLYGAIFMVALIGVIFTIMLCRTNYKYNNSIIKANRSSIKEAING